MELWVDGQELHVRVTRGQVDPESLRRSILDMIHEHGVEVVRVQIEEPSLSVVRTVAEASAAEDLPISWML